MNVIETKVLESDRLAALYSYQIMDTLPEDDFDDITKIASEICDTPISLITLVDKDRQWFKSRYGIEVNETPREVAFCQLGFDQPHQPLIIPDSRKDARTANNPLVQGEPHVIFYTGIPLVNPEGFPLGSLCVIDHQPRELSEQQVQSLQALAKRVIKQLELRRKIIQLEAVQRHLEEANQDLEQFAYMIAHDIKNPLLTMHSFSKLLLRKSAQKLDEQEQQMLGFVNDSAQKLLKLVEDVLRFSQFRDLKELKSERFDLMALLTETVELVHAPEGFNIELPPDLPQITTARAGLQQVLLNLFGNAIKYHDQERGKVTLEFSEGADHYTFRISDDGPGIPPKYHQRIFQPLTTLGQKDRFGQLGTGIGLATVKRIVEKLDGHIRVISAIGEGTSFEFSLARPAATTPSPSQGEAPA